MTTDRAEPRTMRATGAATAEPRRCSTADCTKTAVTWLVFRDMEHLGHVHDCAGHEAIDREWHAVIRSGPMPCTDTLPCTPEDQPTAYVVPTPLD